MKTLITAGLTVGVLQYSDTLLIRKLPIVQNAVGRIVLDGVEIAGGLWISKQDGTIIKGIGSGVVIDGMLDLVKMIPAVV